jgi:hypothetical protein
MIEQVGWDQLAGFPVSDLPAPIAGQGQKQSLRVMLPDQPTPTAALYVWLRGEKTGRATTVTNTIPTAQVLSKTSPPAKTDSATTPSGATATAAPSGSTPPAGPTQHPEVPPATGPKEE